MPHPANAGADPVRSPDRAPHPWRTLATPDTRTTPKPIKNEHLRGRRRRQPNHAATGPEDSLRSENREPRTEKAVTYETDRTLSAHQDQRHPMRLPCHARTSPLLFPSSHFSSSRFHHGGNTATVRPTPSRCSKMPSPSRSLSCASPNSSLPNASTTNALDSCFTPSRPRPPTSAALHFSPAPPQWSSVRQ